MNTVPHSISDDEDADRAASIMVSNLVEEPNPHLHGSGYSEQYRLGRNDRSRDNPDESKATSCPPIKDRKFSEPGHDPDPSCNRDLDLLDRDLDFDLDLDQDQDLDLDQDQDLDLEPSRTEEEDPGMQDHGMQHPRVRDPPIQDPSVQDTAQATDYAVEAEAEEGERRGRVDGSSRPSSPAGSDDDRRDVGRRRPRRFRQLAAQGTDLMADQRNRFRRKSPEGPAPVQTTSVPSDDTLSPGKDDGDGRDRGRERSREGGRGEDAACVSRFMAPSSLLDSPLWSAVESTLPNFRDIAISSCTLGIKTGRLFRSARPFGDYSTLHGVLVDGLKIHTIIDLRDDNLLAIRGEEESRLQVSQLYLLSHVTQKGHTTSRSGYRTPPSRWRSPKKNNRRGLADDARMMEDVYREASVEEFAYKIKGLPSALAEEIIDNQELYPLFETFMRPELKHALVVNVLDAPAVKRRVLEHAVDKANIHYLPLVVAAKAVDKITGVNSLAPYYFCRFVISTHQLENTYYEMVDNCGQNFSIALKIVALSQGPVLFHCTLGKDRTGVLGMLLLHILGASEQAIIFDYSLTECASEMYHNYAKKFIVDMSGLPESFCRATADVMRLTIDYVKRTYGSIDLYLDRFSFGPEWRSYLRRKYLTS